MRVNIKRHIPTILFVTGCVGTVASVIFSAHDTLKAEQIIVSYEVPDEDISETKETLYKVKAHVQAKWKCYIPTAISLSATLACLIASNRLTAKQMAALGTAVAGAGSLVTKYRQAILDRTDPDILHEIDREVAEATMKDAKPPVVTTPGLLSCEEMDLSEDGEYLFFDPFTRVKFVSTKFNVMSAKYFLNRNFAIGGNVSLELFYTFLGVELPEEYRYCQWDVEEICDMGYYWIDIDVVRSSGPDPETGKIYYILEYDLIPGKGEDEMSASYYPFGNPLNEEGSFVNER